MRLIKLNRNFGAYLIFLAISIVFWFMQAIRQTLPDLSKIPAIFLIG